YIILYIVGPNKATRLIRARRDSNPRQPDFFPKIEDKSPVLYLAELRAQVIVTLVDGII
ncbi:MAG: hypothetical protein K0S91_2465, partial [Nitrososphaeraceae archaeon]|nr:hypothetical protein [Nitrososphaeraceae archaeon]